MILATLFFGAVLLTAGGQGSSLTIESDETRVDPARSLFVRVVLKVPRGSSADLPDLRDRVVGFSLAEDFAEEPITHDDGSTECAANWRLVPEPCAETYKIRPFAIVIDGGRTSFMVGPVYFGAPEPRESVTGEMEVEAKKDLPPLSWKLVGEIALGLLVVTVFLGGIIGLIRYIIRRVKEHRMSPIERAWIELDRLLKKGLPGRGRYKDFYVELTMVVRRYVQRKYGIRAPNLTTEEFFEELTRERRLAAQGENLREFLSQADLIKFAGVEATPEMADMATNSARTDLTGDSREVAV